MTKQSSCQFGLAPRGDLPTAFEVGSRATPASVGKGLGSPKHSPPPLGQEFSGDRTPGTRGQD